MEKEKRAKTIKRTITGVIAFPILAVILIFSNTIIMDIFTAIIACISMYEYFHCFKSTKKANPSQYLGYIFCILIAFTHFVDERLLAYIMVLIIPFSLVALFTELVLSKGEKNIKVNNFDIEKVMETFRNEISKDSDFPTIPNTIKGEVFFGFKNPITSEILS